MGFKCLRFRDAFRFEKFKHMKILFIGDLNKHGRCLKRYEALFDLGHSVDGLSTVPISEHRGIKCSPFFERIMWKLSFPLDLTSVNQKIIEAVAQKKYNIIWIEKGNTITPFSLRRIKKILPDAKIVSCSEDNMYLFHNRSFYYRWGLRYYDAVFTVKIHNLTELKSFRAKRVVLFLDAYDEKIHKPIALTEEDRKRFECDVGFIGTFEDDRAFKMLYLAENGIKVVIWGSGWSKWLDKHPNLTIKNTPIYGEDYVRAINATKINLCFLRKLNKDETTSRSAEIPACGGFMLAERTERHLKLFRENEEAAFFNSKEELLSLVKKYLIDESGRNKIAEAGRIRCAKSGYDYKTQLKNMLSFVSGL